MSHFDKLIHLPEGFVVVAKTANSEFAGIAHQTKPIFGTFPPITTSTYHPFPSSLGSCPAALLFHFVFPLHYLQPSCIAYYRFLTNSVNRYTVPPRAWTCTLL